ncbi:copper resistance CopC family protein [Actinomadura kijaniata]|uniref:copper resistance CopC family protein n=1 Tax=Actinomadura kijaniata TaxID=46161 RepID=UPI003F1960E4
MSRRRLAALTAGAALALVLPAAPAAAHTALRSSNPAARSTVEAPREIVLTYSQAISLPKVILTGESGTQYGAGAAEAVDNKVTLPVKPGLPNGRYTVGWRVVSLDGHPVAGSFTFTVKGAATASPTAPGSTAPAPPAPTTTATFVQKTRTESSGSGGWLWIGLGAVLVAAVAGGVAWVRRSPRG